MDTTVYQMEFQHVAETTHQCKVCKQIKRVRQFVWKRRRRFQDGYQVAWVYYPTYVCLSCKRIYQGGYTDADVVDGKLKCTACKQYKHQNEFRYRFHKLGLRHTTCRQCYMAHKLVYDKKRYHSDPTYRMRKITSAEIRHGLRKHRVCKTNATWSMLPYTPEDLWEHLLNHPNAKKDPKITRESYGTYWTIDHIKPVASFDVEDEATFVHECWALSNLQPMNGQRNSAKSSWYNGKKHTYKEHRQRTIWRKEIA